MSSRLKAQFRAAFSAVSLRLMLDVFSPDLRASLRHDSTTRRSISSMSISHILLKEDSSMATVALPPRRFSYTQGA